MQANDDPFAGLRPDLPENLSEALDKHFAGGGGALVAPPYPWCHGNPTREACAKRGYCSRNPSCGD